MFRGTVAPTADQSDAVFARDMMLGRRARTRHFVNQQVVEEWLAFRGNLWPRHGAKRWLLLSLELWLRENGVS